MGCLGKLGNYTLEQRLKIGPLWRDIFLVFVEYLA
jgi:hypothetical protein